jgi:anti-sigma factor ChrR (cupin superfamily)
MAESINGDLSIRVAVDTARMHWAPSPSRSVWRKRVHLVGPPECGQVTSVVRYEPHSTFPAHDHPGGEEIFVLDGVFSDEHGNWPAGTFLLNPEGFRHTPFSEPGCVIFVKLRQFAGRERQHVVVGTHELDWIRSSTRGVSEKQLYEQVGFSDHVCLERWSPEANLGIRSYSRGAEMFVLEGEFADEAGRYAAGCWLRFPASSAHRPHTTRGCTLYVKRAGLPYLMSANEVAHDSAVDRQR